MEQAFPAKSLEPALVKPNQLQVSKLAEVLRVLLREMQHIHEGKTFSACHTRGFNEHHKTGYICGLTKEALSKREVLLICREHNNPS